MESNRGVHQALPRPEPNGHGAPDGAELAQRIDTRATDSSAATDRYAAMWDSSNPTYPPALDEAAEIGHGKGEANKRPSQVNKPTQFAIEYARSKSG